MQARTEAALAVGAFALLAVIALQTGRREQGTTDRDRRASSYLRGPAGLAALAEVIERTGGTVGRWRGRARDLTYTSDATTSLVVANPNSVLSLDDTHTILQWPDSGGNLILAGASLWRPMECLGFDINIRVLDSLQVRAPGGSGAGWVHSIFRELDDGADSERSEECAQVAVSRVDTLLTTMQGDAVALRVFLASEGAGDVILLSDVAPLTNQGLREPGVPEYLIPIITEQRGRVVFDEYHHGFGPGGSMARAALAWSRQSPWGWMVWQLAIVGLFVWIAGAARSGPVRRVFSRERRSSREHVEALANALAAARGHDVAIGLLVNGLRRRLQSRHTAGAPHIVRTDWREWVESMGQGVGAGARTSEMRASAQALAGFSAPGQTNAAVLQAANAVEDVWEKLIIHNK